MMEIVNGKYFRGYLASNDISTAAAIPLFDANGNSITLGVNDRPVIYEGLLSNGATASNIIIFADTNGNGTLDAGEELYGATLPANGVTSFPQASGYVSGRQSDGATKNKLMAKASVASVGTVITIIGNIIQS